MTVNRSILVVASVGDTFDDWADLAAGRTRLLDFTAPS